LIEPIHVRPAKDEEIAQVSDLVRDVFDVDVAPLYVPAGIEVFHSYALADAMRERSRSGHTLLVAEQEGTIVGAAEIRDFNHISLLFVDQMFQRSGIGRILMLEVIRLCREHNPGLGAITVNSSPNAADAYKQLGFRATGELQRKNGIDFIPMELML
jgi:GNAT superfamily N-acetyltransferase